ncbi:MAG TPA: hypothetical protein VFB13_21245 [Reyranella sp.]|nr:hypothetical protein [Reyranella sp.]
MTDDKSRIDQSRVEGEGSYIGTRDYNKRAEKFIKEGKVDRAAKEAERAVDSPENDELAKAEATGKKGDPRKMDKKG